MNDKEGIVFDISPFMLEDGPGIRTNVFLKGCPLRCRWCSNAYGLEKNIQLSYNPGKCVGCGACVRVCEQKAISMDQKNHISVQDFSRCADCMKCVSVCPAEARLQIGRRMTAREVCRIVERDRIFYRRGNGGVTVSGGELLMQADFAAEILRLCHREGIHTAVETSAYGSKEDLEKVLSECDTAFIDCKCMDPEKHRRLTGVDNAIILSNIRFASEFCEQHGIELIIRCPLIPSLNDDDRDIESVTAFVRNLKGEPLLNFLPYHNFGAPKYEFLGKTYATAELKPQTAEELERVQRLADGSGCRYSIGGYDI